MVDLRLGDCLDILPMLPAQSVDAVITDPPYGTTACKWDSVIAFDAMWTQLKRVIRPRGAIVLFGSQPFTSALIMSNPRMFQYEWIWAKHKKVGHLNAQHRPMVGHESILVFGAARPTYNPQGLYPTRRLNKRTNNGAYGACSKNTWQTLAGFPHTLLSFKHDKSLGHPTQKPVALLEYLVKTYTNGDDTVLDFTMGSGTTGVACIQTGRNFIGIEREPHYFTIAQKRIDDTAATQAVPLYEEVA